MSYDDSAVAEGAPAVGAGGSALAPAGLTAGRALRAGGWAATGAGVAGLAGLASSVPWPQLFSLDAVPGNAVVLEPRLSVVLVGHYAILAVGGALGLVAGAALGAGLRRHRWAAAAALVVGTGAAMMGYAAARRAIDVSVHAGRSTVELATLVWAGGSMVLVGTLVVTLALRHRGGKLFVTLGVGAPLLVAAGTATFVVLGPDTIPMIWGVTFPPPPDYLLATWFIVLGWLVRSGRLRGDGIDGRSQRRTAVVDDDVAGRVPAPGPRG